MSDDVLDRVRFRGDPVADPAATVTAGHARFTVLTPRLVRMEWSAERRFEDRASYAFPVRRAAVPAFRADPGGDGTLVLGTDDLVLRWRDDDRPFHPGNLSVELTGRIRARWTPGTPDPDNLRGARRTVDDCRGEAVLEPGLVSRSGWAVHDDSRHPVFDAAGWPAARDRADDLDWYFFGHGHDYAGALAEYARFGGAPPLVPRWVLGAWWSRYHAYDDAELRELVEGFGEHRLPLDVVVIDMDWHLPDSWTGYTWNRALFPDPADTLARLHARHLKTTLNLHPALGVQRFEKAYPEFARRMGVDPTSGEPVPFDITDPEFVRNYFELLHHPHEDAGVDFWWMDWQQGRTSAIDGLDPLTWLNHLHFADMTRVPGRRPVVFSRWGGLGSHRYPVGFSGDTFALWSALAFQPRYTAAGANVAYGWWSHDIGGHSGPDDPELYVRWVQFGAVSPVLRLHSNNQPDSERRPWAFGEDVLDLAREAYRLRYALVPYLYTAARTAVDTGASLVRPTAWVAPEEEGAYLAHGQYLLGPDLLVAPVVRPADPATGLADVDVWLPEGPWVERTTGESCTGPRWLRLGVPADRVPQFVRPGTVLPLADVAPTTTDQDPGHLTLAVVAGDGRARVYDDDGETVDPDAGRWTEVTVGAPDASRCVVTVAPGVERAWTVRLDHVVAPAAVDLDGAPVPDARHDGTTLWVPVPRRSEAFAVDVRADGPLSVTGAAHDEAVRAADLAVLFGAPGADPATAVHDLPPDSPARALAVARLGGPAVQVVEHTTPDEAVREVGRVIVSAPERTPVAEVDVRWTCTHRGRQTSQETGPVEVAGQALVLDAPFAWDGTLVPLQWAVDVTVRWGDVEVVRRHTSAVLNPALGSWWLAVEDPGDGAAAPTAWSRHQVDPADVDFGSLAQRSTLRFRGWNHDERREGAVGRAVTTITVPEDREVALAYVAGGDVSVRIDGTEVAADVTGAPAVKYFTLDPPARRTAAVALPAGPHRVEVSCPHTPDLPAVDWYLSAWAVDAAGRPLLDVTAEAGDAPA